MTKPKALAPDEIEAARAVTRELHEALADTRRALHELRAETQNLTGRADQIARERIEPVCARAEAQIHEVQESVERAEDVLWQRAAELAGAKSPEDFIMLITKRVLLLLKQET